ncbi:ALP1-like protein [Tanacetum coccineum]|uniref:ALP1-like protein n=1 Tax=Tanacetum coccineum TaxID=301880 RepID=A0ABQ5D254_9ASTR
MRVNEEHAAAVTKLVTAAAFPSACSSSEPVQQLTTTVSAEEPVQVKKKEKVSKNRYLKNMIVRVIFMKSGKEVLLKRNPDVKADKVGGPVLSGLIEPGSESQEAGGSSDGPKRRRTYIYREREEAEQRLIDDYFGDDEYEPKYPEEKFRRKYRMSSRLFNKILNDILSYDVQPLPEYFSYFRSRLDAGDFLRRPTATDIQKTYELHEEKHGLPGMLESIDCMHWDWKNCPKSLHGQFKRSTNKYPTLMLEVVADQKLWIWHAYFGVPGANNDLNVLYGSLLFDAEIADIAPECPFVVNGHTYRKGYYLADGIYPTWSTFVKTFSVARDEKTLKFKRVQEAARKDIERAFGVLQGRWGIIRQPARAMQINTLKRIMFCCIILHNMILEDERFEVNLRDVFVNPTPNIVRD